MTAFRKRNMILRAVFTVLLTLVIEVHTYPNGAPTKACFDMKPGHGAQPNTTSPYSIAVSSDKYRPGETLTVNVTGGDYRGIILQARMAGRPTIVGTFSSPPALTKIQQCSAASDTITHMSNAPKNALTFTWKAPNTNVSDVEFIATVAQDKNVWWQNVKSSPVVFEMKQESTTLSPSNVTADGNTSMANTTATNNSTGVTAVPAGTVVMKDVTTKATVSQNNSSGTDNSSTTTPKNHAQKASADIFIALALGSLFIIHVLFNKE